MVSSAFGSHLAEGTEVEAERLCISRACVHVIPQQQHQLQQPAKGAALPDLITGGIYSQDIWTQVVYLLLKLQAEEDVAEARTQPIHTAHLGEERWRRKHRGGENNKKNKSKGKSVKYQKKVQEHSQTLSNYNHTFGTLSHSANLI